MITLKELSYTYPGQNESDALKDTSLHIEPGECVVLCGRSGCGKTTLLRAVNGLIPHFHGGTVTGKAMVAGLDISRSSLPEIALAVGSVFQNPRTQFFHMDTTGELAFQMENQNIAREKMRVRIQEVAGELELQNLLDRDIFALSGGEKQQIACGSIWAAQPRIVVLDEPSSNLDLPGIRRLQRSIRYMKAAGTTVLVSEHRLWYLYGIADRYILLEDGSIQEEYTSEEIHAFSEKERRRMGLRAVCADQLFAIKPEAAAISRTENGLKIQNLICKRKGKRVLEIPQLSVPKGAIVAVIGENGAGKSTLMLCLSGLLKHRGELCLGERNIPYKRLPKEAYLVMQEAGHQLFSDTVLGELMLNNTKLTEKEAMETLEALGLETFKERHPGSLSGGQQQRLSLAVALCSRRGLMLYDEPTSGQDGENLLRTARQIQELNGKAVCSFMVSHDPELILQCATHLLIIHAGKAEHFLPLDQAGVKVLWEVFGEGCKNKENTTKRS